MKEHCVAKILLSEKHFYIKIIFTTITFLFFFALSKNPRTRTMFLASWQSGNEKYFWFLFIAGSALLQRHANSIDFCKGIFYNIILVCT